MSFDYKRILGSAGVFLGVLLIMCFAAKLVIKANADINDGVIRDGSGVLSGSGDAGKASEKEKAAGTGKDKSSSEEGGSGKTDEADGTVNTGSDTNKNGIDGSDDAPDGAGTAENGSITSSADSQNGNENGDSSGDTENGSSNVPDNKSTGDKSSFIVCIDAAHQQKDNSSTEPIGPGADKTKIKCTTGATGVSGLLEYELTLAIAQKLKAELISRGYGVAMTRESHDVDISDATRAQKANERASIVIHIHGNADEREGIAGIMAFAPGDDNPYVKGKVLESCRDLGKAILDRLAAETSAKNWGVISNNNLSALNWTTIPASHVEVGYLTNADEEKLLKTDDYRDKIVKGIADGIDAYYEADR